MRHRAAPVIAVAVVALLAAAAALAGRTGYASAPPLAGTDPMTGKHVDIAKYRGRLVFVNIWASWCAPCRQEAPALRAFAAAHKKDVVVIGIDTKDSVDGARRFYAKYGLSHPSVSDRNGAIAARWWLEGLPTSYYVSPSGKVVGWIIGPGELQTFESRLAGAHFAR